MATDTQVKEIKATFKQQRETKGTVVYREEVNNDGAEIIGSVYVKKTAVKDLGSPKSITVTVAAAT